MVTPAGSEPAIFWMRTRYPGPLDEGAVGEGILSYLLYDVYRALFVTLRISVMNLFSFHQHGLSEKTIHSSADLQSDSAKLKLIIDTIEDGVVLVDEEGTIQFINNGGANICGWPADGAGGINVSS